MKVKELIKELKKFKKDNDVFVAIYFKKYAEVCEVEQVDSNRGHAQLVVTSQAKTR